MSQCNRPGGWETMATGESCSLLSLAESAIPARSAAVPSIRPSARRDPTFTRLAATNRRAGHISPPQRTSASDGTANLAVSTSCPEESGLALHSERDFFMEDLSSTFHRNTATDLTSAGVTGLPPQNRLQGGHPLSAARSLSAALLAARPRPPLALSVHTASARPTPSPATPGTRAASRLCTAGPALPSTAGCCRLSVAPWRM